MKFLAATNARLVLLLHFVLVSTICFSQQQQVIRCYTTEMDSALHAEHPGLETKEQFETWIASAIQAKAGHKDVGGVYVIPVVFHVIHNGESVGSGTNISFAAIQSQVDVLNEDFRKLYGSNGYNTNVDGADTQIEFCLAQRRPDGSAFATGQPGVNRINRNTAGFTAPPFTDTYINSTIKPWTYNNNVPTAARGWDPNKYMNIWICNISGGILGYAQFPQSPLGGMGCTTPVASTDGVVFLYNSIGKSSVTGFAGPYNEGRTATHEIGHWLGLRHIWGDVSDCTTDDYCNDTPIAYTANFNCPTGTNSCTSQPGNDMIDNYMDYTDDLCMDIFTNDQKQRMRTVLENSPLRVGLITSDACIPPNTNDASVVDISNPKGDNCPGAITPAVLLRNRGTATLTSATISYTIDGGAVTTYSWTGSLVTGASATVTLPSFTSTLGAHTFKAYSTLPNGVTDPSADYDTSAINFMISNGEMPNFTETFDGTVFPPDVRWQITNGGSDCFMWTIASGVSSTGVTSNNIVEMPCFGNSTTNTESLETPIFILPCNATNVKVKFDVSYKRKNTSSTDALYVDISTNCGSTWNSTPIYSKSGSTLATITSTTTSEFYPTASSNWRTDSIDISSYVTASSQNIKFRFRGVSANGNNFFIDNFKYTATLAAEADVTQSTSDILDGGSYNFGTVNGGSPSTVTFTVTNNGASTLTLSTPITVTGSGYSLGTSFGSTSLASGASTTFTVVFNPTANGAAIGNVSFTTNDCDEGTYNFQLNGIGANVTTTTAPVANYTASTTSVCAGQTVTYTNTSTGSPTSYTWSFPGGSPSTSTSTSPTVTYNTAGNYNVTLIAVNSGGSDTTTFTNYISVNGAPSAPASISGTASVCSGTTGVAYSVASVTGATTYTWTVPTGATVSSGQGTNSVSVNFGTTAGNITVTAGNSCGTSTAATYAVTLNSAPSAPASISGTASVCSGITGVAYSVASVTGATTYTWTVPSGSTVSSGQGTNSVSVNFGTTAGNITVTAGNSCGTSTAATYAVTFGALPAAPASISGTASVCSGTTGVAYSVPSVTGATTYTWTVPTGATVSSGQGTNSVSVNFGTTAGNITVTAGNSCGTSTAATYAVTLNSAPSAPASISGTASVCSGTTGVTYSVPSVTGATTYTWTVPTGATVSSGQGTNSVSVNFGTTAGNITVTAGNSCGTSTAATYAVTLNSTPSAPASISGTASVCSGTTGVTYSVPSVTGATTYTWTVPTGATVSSGQGTNSVSVNFGTTAGNITVTAGNSCGTSAAATYAVTLNSTPSAPASISGTASVCSGTTGVTYSVPSVTGATTYTWTVPTGATVSSGQGTNSVSVNFGTTAGNITVTAGNSCGTSAVTTYAVTFGALPAAPASISGTTTVCSGDSQTFSVTTSANATSYNWTVPTGSTITSGQGTTSITVDFGTNSGTISVNTSNGCGTSASTTSTITVQAAPAVPSVQVVDGCGVSTLSTSSTGSLNWSTGATTSSIQVTSSGTYTVSQTVNGCTSATATVVANPLAVPVVTMTQIPDVCINDPAFTLTQGSPVGGTYYGSGVYNDTFDPSVVGFGTFIVYYSYTGTNGCTAQAQQTVSVGCAGVEDLNGGSELTVYPNPTSGVVTIHATGLALKQVKVFDNAGKLIFDEKPDNTVEFTMDLQKVAAGMYTIEISSDQQVVRTKITKQ